MRPSLHHSGGDGGGGGGANGTNQAEGGGEGGGENVGGWWRWRRRNEMECSVDCAMALCRRKPHWPTVLSVLGVGWLIATILTGYGMYMVICHAPTQHLEVLTPRGSLQMRRVVMTKEVSGGASTCGGSWTLREGQVTLILGCLLNGFVLGLMLLNMFLDRRRPHTVQIQEQPPDYETLIKEETPPPSYSELYCSSSSSSSSSSGDVFITSSPPTAHHPVFVV